MDSPIQSLTTHQRTLLLDFQPVGIYVNVSQLCKHCAQSFSMVFLFNYLLFWDGKIVPDAKLGSEIVDNETHLIIKLVSFRF
jgi:hypothetical protein